MPEKTNIDNEKGAFLGPDNNAIQTEFQSKAKPDPENLERAIEKERVNAETVKALNSKPKSGPLSISSRHPSLPQKPLSGEMSGPTSGT